MRRAERLYNYALYLNPLHVDCLSHYATYMGKCCNDMESAAQVILFLCPR